MHQINICAEMFFPLRLEQYASLKTREAKPKRVCDVTCFATLFSCYNFYALNVSTRKTEDHHDFSDVSTRRQKIITTFLMSVPVRQKIITTFLM